jgi:hypothetical protein
MSVTEKAGLSTITVAYVGRERDQGGGYRRAYDATITTPQWQYVDNTLRSGVGAAINEREMFGTLMAFLLACVESRQYPQGENADLFPNHVGEWAESHSWELGNFQLEYDPS